VGEAATWDVWYGVVWPDSLEGFLRRREVRYTDDEPVVQPKVGMDLVSWTWLIARRSRRPSVRRTPGMNCQTRTAGPAGASS